jgi:hypothetical protein
VRELSIDAEPRPQLTSVAACRLDRRPSLKHLYSSPTVSAREFTAFLVGAARRESRVHPQGLCAEDHCGARDPVFVRRLALAIGLIAGLLGSQGPEFSQQYRQRIGGALDELKRIVTEFDDEAAREGLTPSQAIMRLEPNSDPLAEERGRDIAQTIARRPASGAARRNAVVRPAESPLCDGGSGADVLLIAALSKFAAQAIRRSYTSRGTQSAT